MELRHGGKTSCPRRVSSRGGGASQAVDLLNHYGLHAELPPEAQTFSRVRLRLLPTPFPVGDPREAAVCEGDMPFVADRGGDLGRLRPHGGRPSDVALQERHFCDVDQRQRDSRHIADPAAQCQALFVVGGRLLVLSERHCRPAEVVQRDREHVVVFRLAGESDRLLARGQCRAWIAEGQDTADVSAGDRRCRGGSNRLRIREACLEQADRLVAVSLLVGEIAGAVEHLGA